MNIDMKDREKLLQVVRDAYTTESTISCVRKEIYKEFGINYCTSSTKYWIHKAFPEYWNEELSKIEETMDRWRKEALPDKKYSEHEIYAEQQGLLFSGQITKEEFNDNINNCNELLILPDNN